MGPRAVAVEYPGTNVTDFSQSRSGGSRIGMPPRVGPSRPRGEVARPRPDLGDGPVTKQQTERRPDVRRRQRPAVDRVDDPDGDVGARMGVEVHEGISLRPSVRPEQE